jgi:hypothetical protein
VNVKVGSDDDTPSVTGVVILEIRWKTRTVGTQTRWYMFCILCVIVYDATVEEDVHGIMCLRINVKTSPQDR